jgi:hypothetical protein
MIAPEFLDLEEVLEPRRCPGQSGPRKFLMPSNHLPAIHA